MTDWNEAMERFQQQKDQHGIADCKKRIGRALAEMGYYGVAQDLIREAIAIYAALEKEPSRISAVCVLGDVLVMRGTIDDARNCYEEGLAFSRSIDHTEWIARFEASLKKLSTAGPESTAHHDLPESRCRLAQAGTAFLLTLAAATLVWQSGHRAGQEDVGTGSPRKPDARPSPPNAFLQTPPQSA